MAPIVEISHKGFKRVQQGHPWVYRSDVLSGAGVQAGEVVQVVVKGRSGGITPVGTAFFSTQSLITLRMISRELLVPDEGFWHERIQRALSWRLPFSQPNQAVRLVYSEADELPGLIVDCYGDVAVIQTLCAGAEQLKETFVESLNRLLHPRVIVERNDSSVRKLEGLDERVCCLQGQLSGPVEIHEGKLRLLVDPIGGQKTGSYLDQRDNHLQAARYAQGRCLDVFAYQGGFGLQLKLNGAQEVILVEQSERALEVAERIAELNQLTIRVQAANAFDFLHEQQARGEKYQVVVLDPPAFAKNRQSVQSALRGYKEINLRAIQLLDEGGILISSSCSYHLSESLFEQVLRDAAQDAKRLLQVVERRSQAWDHPERIGFPESRYLKCFILRVL